MRDRLAGTVRITADELAVDTVLWPALSRSLPDYDLTDIAVDRCDARVRLGGIVAKDM